MKVIVVLFSVLLQSFSSAAAASIPPSNPWELINENEGVKVFRRQEAKGSPVVNFRGEGLVDAPLEKVASVLFDCVRSKEWVEDEVESRIDHWVNDFEWIEYDHMGTPFVVKDRDFVTHGKGETHKDGYDILLTYKSVSDPSVPLTKYVRGDVLRAISGMNAHGTKTYVVMEAQVDPKGTVPLWLVNMVQKSWAIDTFRALRKQLKKPDIGIDPFIQKLLAKPTRNPKRPRKVAVKIFIRRSTLIG